MAAVQYQRPDYTYRSHRTNPNLRSVSYTAGVPSSSGLGIAASGGLAVFRVAGAGLLNLTDSVAHALLDRAGETTTAVAARAAYELGHGVARDLIRAA